MSSLVAVIAYETTKNCCLLILVQLVNPNSFLVLEVLWLSMDLVLAWVVIGSRPD